MTDSSSREPTPSGELNPSGEPGPTQAMTSGEGPVKPPSASVAIGSRRSPILMTLLWFAVLGLGGVVWWLQTQWVDRAQRWDAQWLQLHETRQRDEQALQADWSAKLQTALAEQSQNQARALAGLDAVQAQAQSRLQQLETQVAAQQVRLQSLSRASREDWLLAEAQYLLRIAQQRWQLETDVPATLALIERADALVATANEGLGDSDLVAVRQGLANDSVLLKRLEPIDTVGIYMALDALATQIESLSTVPDAEERLPLALPDAQANSLSETSTGPSGDSGGAWQAIRRQFAGVVTFLNSAFRLQDASELTNPLTSQSGLALMQLNSRLAIEQANIALLKGQPELYRTSLLKAARLLRQYYFDSEARNVFVEELDRLAQLTIVPERPELSKALVLLQAYIAEQHRLTVPVAGAIGTLELEHASAARSAEQAPAFVDQSLPSDEQSSPSDGQSLPPAKTPPEDAGRLDSPATEGQP